MRNFGYDDLLERFHFSRGKISFVGYKYLCMDFGNENKISYI